MKGVWGRGIMSLEKGGKKFIDNLSPLTSFFLSPQGREKAGKRIGGERRGVGNVVNSERVFQAPKGRHFPCPRARGEGGRWLSL